MTLSEWLAKLFNIKPKPKPFPTPIPTPIPAPIPNPTPTPKPTPNPTPTPTPIPQNLKAPDGNGMMQGGDQNQYLSDAQINNPKLKFFVPRERWKYLNPSPTVFDFKNILREIDRYVKAGKPYLVPVMTGTGCNPSWLNGEPPWSLKLLDAYFQLQTHLEAATRSEYRIGVWVTGPTISSQEMHYSAKNVTMTSFAGYTPDKLSAAWCHILDEMDLLYADCSKILSLSFQGNAVQKTMAYAYVPQVVNYARQILSKGEVCFQFNSLQETTDRTYIKPLLDLHAQGYRTGGEKVQPGHNVQQFDGLDYIVNYPKDERFL